MSEQPEKKKNSKFVIFIILSIVLFILLIVVSYLYLDKKSQVEGLVSEKEQIKVELQAELDLLMDQHNQVKTEYGQLSDSLLARDSIIIADAKEIKQLLNYKWDYYKIKKKLGRLQVAAQGYVRQMDSLHTVNQTLKEENKRIRANYRSEKEKNLGLVEEKEELIGIVDQAAVLRAYNIIATGIRQRGTRQKETDKANRTDRVRVCFTLGENSLVGHGKKNIYLRIARPDNVILAINNTDEYSFEFEGTVMQYSMKREVDYKGETIDMCVYWNKGNSDENAMTGRYHVVLYTDDSRIGESFFELK
ncbi:MAG: hypothetical protein B6D64_13815 [Bacteroidetes bacterium 4484_276]|nr:MAG: hypothetical protein B6D64_13815 [Bacteroidetes bacterium 4484_276]OYT12878.1 MAG: hypothetical protein B6I19_08015 [Bacteroidetes bacterium 4572_114]